MNDSENDDRCGPTFTEHHGDDDGGFITQIRQMRHLCCRAVKACHLLLPTPRLTHPVTRSCYSGAWAHSEWSFLFVHILENSFHSVDYENYFSFFLVMIVFKS